MRKGVSFWPAGRICLSPRSRSCPIATSTTRHGSLRSGLSKDYLDQLPSISQINQKVCIYDRDKALSDVEIETIYEELDGTPFVLAHRGELPLLLESTFNSLR